MSRIAVIGGVAAGMSAAARAKRLDPSCEVTVIEKGEYVTYGACGLPYFLEGRMHRAQSLVVYTPDYLREKRGIDVRTGIAAESVSLARREVALSDGSRLGYDRLIFATGARARTGLPGAAQPHVFTLQTIPQAEAIQAFLQERKPKRAVVVGAGYLGLEAAEALRYNGLEVTVMTRGANVLRRGEPWLTELVAKHLDKFGVPLRLSAEVSAIGSDDVAGEPADIVVLAVGFRPNAELAAEAGVMLGRTGAIAVNDLLETNVPAIYAAGDCAEHLHRVTAQPVYHPLGTSANKMGRIAGANAAGHRERFPGIVGTGIVGIFGLGIGVTGLSAAMARDAGFDAVAARIEAPSRARYMGGRPATVELVADRRSGRLLGATVVGEQDTAGRINTAATALTARLTVEEFAQLDLAYAPPFATVWDPLLIAAQQLLKDL